MQLYLNYQHRAFVFTQEMLVAMGRPAFVGMWNDQEDALLFVPMKTRPKEGACWKIPVKVYEDGYAYAVGNRVPFTKALAEYIGADVPAVVELSYLDVASVPDAAFSSGKKPSGVLLRAQLRDLETCFYTTELDHVYVQEEPGRTALAGNKRVYVG